MSKDIDTAIRMLAGDLAAEADVLARRMADRIADEVPELARPQPEVRSALLASCQANMDLSIAVLAGDRRLPAEPPPDAREFARLAARIGIPVAAALRAYRIGHALAWERWLELVEARRADARLRSALLRETSRFMFDYVDHVSAAVSEIHASEVEAVRRGREQRALELVRAVLDDREAVAPDALEGLAYPLDAWHVGVFVSGLDARSAVAAVGRWAGASASLVVPLAGELAWGWVARRRPPGRLDGPPATEGAALALGEPGHGPDGFRLSHAQAGEAHRVGVLSGAPVTRYADVAMVAVALGDVEAARRFVAHELPGLRGDDARSVALRDTLRAWFESGQNAASAAARLGVHENTVANRLQAVERRIGRSPAARRAELELALRLHGAGLSR